MILYEKIPPLVFECSIDASKEKDLILPRLILNLYGFKEGDICENYENKEWSLKVFSENKKEIESFHQALKKVNKAKLKVSIRSLKPKQWLTRWKTNWKPLSLTKTIDVVPAWYQGSYKSSKDVILLDTLMSFGTGMHETTQLISRLIEENKSQLESFLDIGTGTGILAILAIKLGSRDVTAMDISPLSVEATQKNLKVNHLKAKVFLGDIGKLPAKIKYQTVAANLITEDLLKFKQKIFNLVKPGGMLMISGISLENLNKITAGFRDLPLKCLKISKGKQWAAISYAKKML